MDLDVRLLYVERFEDKLHPDSKKAHPKAGDVYRAIKRKTAPRTPDVYQLFFDDMEMKDPTNIGMFLPGLEADNKLFSFKMKEVSIDDILDLDLDEDTYERMKSWGPSFTEGITERHINIPIMNGLGNDPSPQELKDLAEDITRAINNAAKSIGGNKGLAYIGDNDPQMKNSIQLLITYIAETFDDKYESSLIGTPAQRLIHSKAYGKGVNMFNAIKYLQRYMSDGHSKSGNPQDVLKALHYLLFELTRLIIHGEIEA